MKPPEHLTDEALLEWDRVCEELQAARQLEDRDRAILTLYVEAWEVYQKATKAVTKHGAVIKYSNGSPGLSPFYKAQQTHAKLLRGLLADLGLTPASRMKGSAPSKDKKGAGAGSLNF